MSDYLLSNYALVLSVSMPSLSLNKAGERSLKRLTRKHRDIGTCFENTKKLFEEGNLSSLDFKSHQGSRGIFKIELQNKWPWRVMLIKLDDQNYIAYEVVKHDDIYRH